MSETIKVSEISEGILKHFEATGMVDPEGMRLGLGLTLSSLHTATIYAAKTPEAKKEAVQSALNSIERLAQSLQQTVEDAKIEGVRIEIGEKLSPIKGRLQ